LVLITDGAISLLAALGWKIKEDFFKDSTVLSDLKLRLGWGITGQQSIDSGRTFLSIQFII